MHDKKEGDILNANNFRETTAMTKNDWYEAGDQIKKLVQDAVDSKDFSQLSDTITNVVNETVNGLQSALKENLSQKPQGGQTGQKKSSARNPYEYTNREAAQRIKRNMQEKRRKAKEETKDRAHKPVRVKIKAPGEITGTLLKWFGYSMGGVFGLSLIIYIVVAVTGGFFAVDTATGVLTVFFLASVLLGAAGSSRAGLAKRFRRYQEIIGNRTYCLVEELAAAVGRSCKFVGRDLRKMISRGFFREGYMDRKGTLLITDQSTYQQYLATQAEYERRGLEEEKRREQERRNSRNGEKRNSPEKREMPPQCQELIEEGQKYIAHIRECNERIEGQEFSKKLDRLELVITRIFCEVEKDPEDAGELKKMMSYYLPTTKKLLDAYCEMDEQPIAGENVENTKREIENALDTLNTAFEKLLDGFFEEKAWDISSDIQVLQNMLAQEGLTGTDFTRK